MWFGPDNNGQIDGEKLSLPDQQSLTSPVMHVESGPLTISFQHRFSFESNSSGNWDGGIVEISNDGGATWTKVGTNPSFYNGVTNGVTTAPIGANKPAFVGRSTGWPNFINASISLTAFANQDVQIRFRIGADDSTGAPGWDIDNIVIGGLSTTPFTAIVPETGTCP